MRRAGIRSSVESMANHPRRRIRLIAWNNGVGLSRDLTLLATALRSLGHDVQVCGIGRGKLRKWFRPGLTRLRTLLARISGGTNVVDLNIFLEHIRPEDFGRADRNVFIPNPEWCHPKDLEHLDRVDAIWAKTQHAVPLFEGRAGFVDFIGFTSEDRHLPDVIRERQFFHLAGRSSNKGTTALLAFWRANPQLPKLVVVQSPKAAANVVTDCENIEHRVDYLDEDTLRELQNASMFHLCPSETEGFGHYLVEAMSVGAVVLTTGAPPMNEFVADGRGIQLVPDSTGRQALATTYHVDANGFETGIARALELTESERKGMGIGARHWFMKNDAEFPSRLSAALERLFVTA